MRLPRVLKSALKRRKVILFVGAGLSATLNAPTWSGLIDRLASEMGYEPSLFKSLGTFPALAEYYFLNNPSRAHFVRRMQREFARNLTDVSKSRAHTALAEAHFPIIYTTNYDDCLEQAHKKAGYPYSLIRKGEDIERAAKGQLEIVKFHGDFAEPNTMVITETDFFERLRFDKALDIKLRADLLTYNVLYIGYSLNDINIRRLLYYVSLIRNEYSPSRATRTHSFAFTDRENAVQTALFRAWRIETIVSPVLDRTAGITEFLETVARVSMRTP